MYRFMRYKRDNFGQIEHEIFELKSKADLSDWSAKNKGWYSHPNKVPEFGSDDPIALELLAGQGLNHSSYTRAVLGKEKIDLKDKQKTKKDYNVIIEHFGDRIYKQNKDWFLNADDNS